MQIIGVSLSVLVIFILAAERYWQAGKSRLFGFLLAFFSMIMSAIGGIIIKTAADNFGIIVKDINF